MTTPTRAVSYVRVSSAQGIDDSLSPETQRRAIAEYCQRQGWTLTAAYEDLGFSGWREDRWDKRPGWLQMLADAQRSQFDVVVVHTLDRFARRTEGVTYRALLKRCGVRLVSVTEPLDDSETGEWMMDIIGANARFFSAIHSTRIRGVKRSRAERGYHNASRIPFGYVRGEGRSMVADGRYADAVRLAYEMAATGEHSAMDIARRLNADGYRTTLGNAFEKNAVWSILRNPVYCGFTRYHDRLIDGQHEALVDPVTWQRVQDTLKARRHVPSHERRPALIYPLTGLLYCARCGHRLVGQIIRKRGEREHRYYYDRGSEGEGCSKGAYVPADALEAAVFGMLEAIVLPAEWRDQLAEYYSGTKTATELEQERAKLRTRTERLAQVFVDGLIAKEDYQRERTAIEAAASRLSATQIARAQDIGDVVLSFARAWEHATAAERKTLCHLLIARIDVEDGQVARVYPRPDLEGLLIATGYPLLVTGGFISVIDTHTMAGIDEEAE